ncbi:MAG: HNH endonuclease [Myxococcota bacterium]|nr:HNH endonuclease [Myxococcota bacterium]
MKQRGELDVEEARALRRLLVLRMWKKFGYVSALDYLEREIGYAPREGRDRLRVARELGTLPKLEAALASNQLKYTAVRELVRVATPVTEAAFLAKAIGKNLRQVEDMVSGLRKGDPPDAPPDPSAVLRTLKFEELAPETYALAREARVRLSEELGMHLEDNEFLATVLRRALEGIGATADGGAAAGPTRPSHQIAVTICKACKRGEQLAGGRKVALGPTAIDRAMCDAQFIGELDAERPERATADVTPAVRRLVLHRDGRRCTAPGCRSARALDIHHIVHREHGGSHGADNLILLCGAHHQHAHDGVLEISGRAPDQVTFVRRDLGAHDVRDPDKSHESDEAVDRIERLALETEARHALTGLGFKVVEARCAVDVAMTHVGHGALSLEVLVREALRHAPKPRMPARHDPRGSGRS